MGLAPFGLLWTRQKATASCAHWDLHKMWLSEGSAQSRYVGYIGKGVRESHLNVVAAGRVSPETNCDWLRGSLVQMHTG